MRSGLPQHGPKLQGDAHRPAERGSPLLPAREYEPLYFLSIFPRVSFTFRKMPDRLVRSAQPVRERSCVVGILVKLRSVGSPVRPPRFIVCRCRASTKSRRTRSAASPAESSERLASVVLAKGDEVPEWRFDGAIQMLALSQEQLAIGSLHTLLLDAREFVAHP